MMEYVYKVKDAVTKDIYWGRLSTDMEVTNEWIDLIKDLPINKERVNQKRSFLVLYDNAKEANLVAASKGKFKHIKIANDLKKMLKINKEKQCEERRIEYNNKIHCRIEELYNRIEYLKSKLK